MKTPPTIETLNPIAAPLQGINLIEASAGTGKTYTITTLFMLQDNAFESGVLFDIVV